VISRGVVVFAMKERVKGQEEGEENKRDEMAHFSFIAG
jgi:hypothetical protein